MTFTFTHDYYGTIEVRPMSASDPVGYVYFKGQDYETTFMVGSSLLYGQFNDYNGQTYTVVFGMPNVGSATLSIIREVNLMSVKGS